MAVPSVYAYLDYRAFLRDWFDARKQVDPEYSFAVFAREGGCSKASLANVLGGVRRPRADTLDAFARAMALPPAERSYLGLLVELAGAADLTQRREVMDRILSCERYRQVRMAEGDPDEDVARYLAHWYVPVIREMAGLPGFQADPQWIASALAPAIGPEEAGSALDTLLDLGFLARTDDGGVRQREIRFTTRPTNTQLAVLRYHREVIPGLMREIRRGQGDQRHLGAATISLDAAGLVEAKARIALLMEQLGGLADEPSPSEPRKVYQFAVQLLPVTVTLP